MDTWSHSNGLSTLNGVPASMFYHDQLVGFSIVDTVEQQEVFSRIPGSILVQEGIANDVSTFINRSRKSAGCGVSDDVRVLINCGEGVAWSIVWNLEKLLKNTKTVHIDFNVNDDILNSGYQWDEYEAGSKDVPFPVAIHVMPL